VSVIADGIYRLKKKKRVGTVIRKDGSRYPIYDVGLVLTNEGDRKAEVATFTPILFFEKGQRDKMRK
jgi:hypothetical protein